MQNQLKPCPYCGSRNISLNEEWPHYQAICNDCHATGPDSNDKTIALLAWNAATLQWQRTPPEEAGFYFYRNFFGCIQVVNVFAGMGCQREGEWAGPIPVPGK